MLFVVRIPLRKAQAMSVARPVLLVKLQVKVHLHALPVQRGPTVARKEYVGLVPQESSATLVLRSVLLAHSESILRVQALQSAVPVLRGCTLIFRDRANVSDVRQASTAEGGLALV